jgi:hypothetical protein
LEIEAMKKGYYLWSILAFLIFCVHLSGGRAEGCAACVAAGKLARESENKAFYALRILYERRGREALPVIRRALALDNNPPAQMRAVGYVAELNDTESIPQLEGILAELHKKVSFSQFGIGTVDFQKRWIVAYTLGTLRAPGVAERIWERYERFTPSKKTEVPYILSALGDTKLTEHLMGIIDRSEDHPLMMATLDTMATGANAEAIPFLKSKIIEWEAKAKATSGSVDIANQVDYFVLSRTAAQVIPQIEERARLGKGQLESREYPIKEEFKPPSYF